MEAFTNCNNVHSSAVMALASVYGLGNMSGNSLCTEKGVSFFCNAITVLCSNNNGSTILNEQCIQVRDNFCALEWRVAENLLLNGSFPDCSSFDDGTNLTFLGSPTQICPSGFDVFCNSLCLPVCGDLDISQYSDAITNAYIVWSILAFVISTTGGMIAFVAFYLKRDTM